MLEIVDTHQHLWDLSRHSYSWCAGIQLLDRTYGMSDYLAAANGLNIVQSVHVEADVDEKDIRAETNWLLGLAREPSNPLSGLVIKALPEREDFLSYVDSFAGESAVKGVRRVLHTQADDLSTGSLFRKNVAALATRNLTFDLCVLGRQLPVAIALAQACPDVLFVLDHEGVPDIKGNAFDTWREPLKELSRLPNVVGCKISGLVVYADGSRDLKSQIKPYIDHAIDCFGPTRVMFGSDWPVCLLATTLANWFNLLDELTRSFSAEDRSNLFAQNARRIYRLPPT